ncbi:MAG: glutaredoxin family protein [Thaumarchaeota archaeon]|nr:MAG: glutaredoxin family protein [Nitrososphaerota archaeon]
MDPKIAGGARLPETRGALEVVLFSKSGCHLCEAVEAEIRSMATIGTSLTVVDIYEDSVLHDKYWMRIPVVRVEATTFSKPR